MNFWRCDKCGTDSNRTPCPYCGDYGELHKRMDHTAILHERDELKAMLAICEELDPWIVEQARLKVRESAE